LALAEGCGDARNWDLLFPAALTVSPNCIAQRSFKEVDLHAKSGCAGWCNVSRSIAWQRIRVVDHKRLPARLAGGKEKLFRLPRSQHIQADANVTFEETLAMSFPSLERQQKSLLPSAHCRPDFAASPIKTSHLLSFGNFAGRAPLRTVPATGTYFN